MTGTTGKEGKGEAGKRAQRRSVVAASSGLVAWYLCAHWTNAAFYAGPGTPQQLNLYAFTSAALVLVGILGLVGIDRSRLCPVDYPLAAAAGAALVSIVANAEQPFAQELAIPLLAVLGASQAWLFVSWCRLLARMDFAFATASLLCATIAIAVFKVASSPFPAIASTAVVAALPLASTVAMRSQLLANRTSPMPIVHWKNLRSLGALALTAVSVATFFFVWSLFNMILKTTTGHYSLGPQASFPLTLFTHVIVIACAAGLAAWAFKRKESLEFVAIWRLLYVFIALSLLVTVVSGMGQTVQVFTGAAIELGFAFYWMALVDIARHSTLPPLAILGFGGLLQSVPDWFGRSVPSLFDFHVLDETAVASLFFIIVVSIAFFLPHRSHSSQMLFSDLGRKAVSVKDHESIDTRCLALGERYGLSQREVQIIQLLCKGRSKPYIAETLFLSENTVRTYTRNAYRKLNVHSKQDLIDLLGGSEETEG
ncbi:helix-turn-helix transcriptional regulator [Rubneribacter sp.]